MFGNEKWQIERVISEVELLSKENIVFFSDEIEKHIIPDLKEKDSKDLSEGKAVQVVVYDEDTKNSFNLKLTFQQPFYHLSDTTELFEKMELTPGQRIGFRYEGWFATLVVKRWRSWDLHLLNQWRHFDNLHHWPIDGSLSLVDGVRRLDLRQAMEVRG
ncbi:hypothetical protein QYF36_020967 [Acer negundo]|nr:hypothetical protein QYF36_020967 [Acer negundo]